MAPADREMQNRLVQQEGDPSALQRLENAALRAPFSHLHAGNAREGEELSVLL